MGIAEESVPKAIRNQPLCTQALGTLLPLGFSSSPPHSQSRSPTGTQKLNQVASGITSALISSCPSYACWISMTPGWLGWIILILSLSVPSQESSSIATAVFHQWPTPRGGLFDVLLTWLLWKNCQHQYPPCHHSPGLTSRTGQSKALHRADHS